MLVEDIPAVRYQRATHRDVVDHAASARPAV
jgi:hypothetical protein